jgi:glycosyltransferase involved in cell wall biosynthesis
MTRLLGVQIADGFSYEARAFALLLRYAAAAAASGGAPPFTARVLCQGGRSSEGVDLARRFPADASKLLGRPSGASGELEWGRGAADPALRFAEEATGETVGVAVVALDFGWRPAAGPRQQSDRVRARLRFVSALPRALEMGREAAPDVVYSGQGAWDVYAATYLARRLRLPQVLHLRRGGPSLTRRPLAGRLRTAALVLAESEEVAEAALRAGAPAGRVSVLPGPVEVRDLPTGADREERRRSVRSSVNIPESAPLVAGLSAAGTGAPNPGAIEAFARVGRGGDGGRNAPHLLVLGAGVEETEAVEDEARRLGVADRVRHAPTPGGHAAVLPAADVALDLSAGRGGAYGPALCAAGASAVPVVTAAPGAAAFVEDGVTGLVAPAGDVEGMADRLARLLAAPEQAATLGAAARRRVAGRYAPEGSGREFARLLGDALAAVAAAQGNR